MMPTDKPSDLETQILAALWREGPATARELLARLPDGKPRAYTSVLSMLQGMERKGFLSREREGLTDRWQPAVSRSEVLGPLLRRLVANVFGGRPADVLQHLLSETEVGEADLGELRALLDAHRPARSPKAKKKPTPPRP